MVPTIYCPLKAASFKMAPTVGMVGKMYIPRMGRGWGATTQVQFLGLLWSQPMDNVLQQSPPSLFFYFAFFLQLFITWCYIIHLNLPTPQGQIIFCWSTDKNSQCLLVARCLLVHKYLWNGLIKCAISSDAAQTVLVQILAVCYSHTLNQ